MKLKIICLAIVVFCISALIYEKHFKKPLIYISFEDIDGYSYYFKQDSLGNDESIILRQEGSFSYKYWKLEIDKNKKRIEDKYLVEEVDIVSQFWIINNISGFQIIDNPDKTDNYRIYVIKEYKTDSVYVYPISELHYLIE